MANACRPTRSCDAGWSPRSRLAAAARLGAETHRPRLRPRRSWLGRALATALQITLVISGAAAARSSLARPLGLSSVRRSFAVRYAAASEDMVHQMPPQARLKHLLSLDSGDFEHLMDQVASSSVLPDGLVQLIQKTCKEMGVLGPCIPKVVGGVGQGVALDYYSDIDVHVETPHHRLSRGDHAEICRRIEKGLPGLGLKKVHLGHKALRVTSLADDSDLEIEIVFTNTTRWSELQPDPVRMDKDFKVAVRALKIAFRGYWFNFLFVELVKILKEKVDCRNMRGDAMFACAVEHLRDPAQSDVVRRVMREQSSRYDKADPPLSSQARKRFEEGPSKIADLIRSVKWRSS